MSGPDIATAAHLDDGSGDAAALGARHDLGPGMRASPLARLGSGNIQLVMPYMYVVVLGGAILCLQPRLLTGPGAIDALFSLVVPLALVAFGQTLALMTRGVDLSVGGVISLVSSLLATQLNDRGPIILLEILAVIALGLVIGCLNGVMIVLTGMQPFIVTLATWSIGDGIAFAVLPIEGGTVSPTLANALTGAVLGVPKSVLIVAALFVLWFVVRRSRFVRDVTAIGSDEVRAHLLGVPIRRRKIQAYAACAFFGSLAGIYLTVQAQSGSPDAGDQFILNSIAAVMLGGASIFGGKGSAASSIAGAVAFLLIPDLVFALGLTSFWSIFFQGFILIVAVTFNSAVQHRARAAA
jgi:ribose transport system permease protein